MNTRHYYLRLLRTFALAALTAAATAACSDDNDENDGREPVTPDGGIPVTFTANINPGSDANPAAAPGTRTILTPDGGGFTVKWKGANDYANNCDNIDIWAAKEADNIGPQSYNPTTSAASSALVPTSEGNKLILSSAGEWTFTAIYGSFSLGFNSEPYANIGYQRQSEPDNTEHIARRDFSVATATKHVETGDMPDINLRFKHKLSALQLRVTNQTGEELTISEIRLAVDGGQIATEKYYDLAMGDWKAAKSKDDYLSLGITTTAALAPNSTPQDFHMLLFPEPEHSRTNMTVTVITSRGEYSRTKDAPDGGFLAGKNYLTDITIKSSGLTAEEKWVEYISNKAELIAFRDNVNNGNNYSGKTVRLTADIDLTNETWTTPIGTDYTKRFSGTFDGGGYHISKLSVDYGSNAYAGLFGYIYKGTVRNLRVSGTVTTTGNNVGGIAGYLSTNSTVENCIFDGDVSARNGVGGIAGYSQTNSRIAGCHTKGKVTTTETNSQYAGGIAGQNVGSTIDGCYSEAEVTVGSGNAGGIAGTNENGSTIAHCYAMGKVSGSYAIGGIVGFNDNSTLTGCIALNPGLTRTSGSNKRFGRIVGDNQGGTLTSCAAYEGMTFTDANGSFTGTGEAGTALPAADCLTPAAYTSRDFPEATATTPGWAFSAATPWTYLPWNKVFEDFPGITNADEYCIKVPAHLKAPAIP